MFCPFHLIFIRVQMMNITKSYSKHCEPTFLYVEQVRFVFGTTGGKVDNAGFYFSP